MAYQCPQCHIPCIEGCQVYSGSEDLSISKYAAGKGASAELKAAVCPQCGLVLLYAGRYQGFSKFVSESEKSSKISEAEKNK